jgi:cupin 2 domain-containing protein
MAEAQLRLFREKVRQLNAFLALCDSRPKLLQELTDCSHHDQVVAMARRAGFEIGRRWGEMDPLTTGEGTTPSMDTPHGPCPSPGSERTEVLLQSPILRLERIHSCAAVTPEGQWYDQEEHEWVLLLQGRAQLRFRDEQHDRQLAQGESLLIKAGHRHRVTATDPAPGTIWLALFWRDP